MILTGSFDFLNHKSNQKSKMSNANIIDLVSSDDEESVGVPLERSAAAAASAHHSVSDRAERKRQQLVSWCFTLYPHKYGRKAEAREDLSKMGEIAKYLIAGKEKCPSTNLVHYQGYVIFDKKRRITELKRLFNPTIHWEGAVAGPKANIDYCSKEDPTPIEFGERPAFENNGEREKNRWMDAKDSAIAGKIDDVDPQIYVQHFTSLQKIVAAHRATDTWLEKPKNVWLYGVPGSGKSFKARTFWKEQLGDPYLKGMNKWWDGYSDQDMVLMEDIDPSHSYLLQAMKTWTDRYPFPAEVKGAVLSSIRPKLLVVTSNHSIEEVFGAGIDSEAVRRRFEVEYFPMRWGDSQASTQVIPETPRMVHEQPKATPMAPVKKRRLRDSDTESEDEENEV